MTIKGLNTIVVSSRIPVDLWWDLVSLCVDQNCNMNDLIKQTLEIRVQAAHTVDSMPEADHTVDSMELGPGWEEVDQEVVREVYKVTPEADYVKKMRKQGKEWYQIRQGLREKFELDLASREVKELFHK